MAWKTHPGLKGKIYVPQSSGRHKKKHNCPDCYSCQQCGVERCRLCQTSKSPSDSQTVYCPVISETEVKKSKP
ncbi:MAG: hypothetical protein GY874_21550 [Desulfobacteraceae bacterium]|nr:hypothetical protein [Desulfobacteraceae bacterium]